MLSHSFKQENKKFISLCYLVYLDSGAQRNRERGVAEFADVASIDFLCVADLEMHLKNFLILVPILKESFSHSNRAEGQNTAFLLYDVFLFCINRKYLTSVNYPRLSSLANGDVHLEFLCLLQITQDIHICIEDPIYF